MTRPVRLLLGLSAPLLAAIDRARGDKPRGPWIEQQLRRLRAIRSAADELDLTLPERADDGRGKWPRKR